MKDIFEKEYFTRLGITSAFNNNVKPFLYGGAGPISVEHVTDTPVSTLPTTTVLSPPSTLRQSVETIVMVEKIILTQTFIIIFLSFIILILIIKGFK